jgi:hypothetical protein
MAPKSGRESKTISFESRTELTGANVHGSTRLFLALELIVVGLIAFPVPL